MYLAPHDTFMSPLPTTDCFAIRHPGQVRQRRTRAGIQKGPDYINFHWIPDLVRLGGLVRNDALGDLRHSFQGECKYLRS
jgi:hypothetical protein